MTSDDTRTNEHQERSTAVACEERSDVPAPTPGPIISHVDDIPPTKFPPRVPPMPLATPEVCEISQPPGYKGPSNNNPGPNAAPGSTPYVPPAPGGPGPVKTPKLPGNDQCEELKRVYSNPAEPWSVRMAAITASILAGCHLL